MHDIKTGHPNGECCFLCRSPTPVVPFYPCLGEGSPTKIDYIRKGALILSSRLEDLVVLVKRSRRGHLVLTKSFWAARAASINCLDNSRHLILID